MLSILLLLFACNQPTPTAEPALPVDAPAHGVADWDHPQGPPIGPVNNDLLLVQADPAIPGSGNRFTLTVSGAVPGQQVGLIRSEDGPGSSSFCPSAMNRNCVGVLNPMLVGLQSADSSGNASFELPLPRGYLVDTTRYYQAGAVRDGGHTPNFSQVLEVVAEGTTSTCGDITPDFVVAGGAPQTFSNDTCLFDETVTSTCAGRQRNPDVIYHFTASVTGTHRFHTDNSPTPYDTAMHLRDPHHYEALPGNTSSGDVDADLWTCGEWNAEVACDDDGASGTLSRIDLHMEAGQEVLVVVDGYSGSSCGAYQLDIELVP